MNWEIELNTLLEERNIKWVVQSLIESPKDISQLLELTKSENEKIAWRAAWVIDHLNMRNPELISPFLHDLLQILKNTHFNGVRRSLLKIAVTAPSSIKEDGEILDLCFKWIYSPAFPIAVRVYSMQFVFDLLPRYPELKNEFCHSLEFALVDQSKGIGSKARKLLMAIRKQ
ncbi:hypothetical protein [Marinilabilia sp.]|uniref:hypothetical protein n=1 Tax=Marinilabilia sp. TaxID=2021252 RepID=UPI0025C71EEE|nr:hypothetical protein [Marinilabilia sp.]